MDVRLDGKVALDHRQQPMGLGTRNGACVSPKPARRSR